MPGKIAYRVKNWSTYNRSLINRGNITLWLSNEAVAGWQSQKKRAGRGRPEEFSDAAIERCVNHLWTPQLTKGNICRLPGFNKP
jgi:Transposase DDE domain